MDVLKTRSDGEKKIQNHSKTFLVAKKAPISENRGHEFLMLKKSIMFCECLELEEKDALRVKSDTNWKW